MSERDEPANATNPAGEPLRRRPAATGKSRVGLDDLRTGAAIRFGLWASVGAAPILLLTLLLAFWIQGEIAEREMRQTFEDLGDPPPFNPSPPGPAAPAPADLLRNPPIRLPGD